MCGLAALKREGAESYKMSRPAERNYSRRPPGIDSKSLKYQEKSAMREIRQASRTGSMECR